MVEKVGSDNFEEEVLRSPVPVLVDFFQLHCLPCKRMDPVLEELQQRIGDAGRVRCVQFEDDAQLIIRYDVMSFPTMILFVDGEVRKRYIGPKPIEMLEALFNGEADISAKPHAGAKDATSGEKDASAAPDAVDGQHSPTGAAPAQTIEERLAL